MNVEFRKCKYSDIDFILKLKELCFKWYIEIIYGWDIKTQREKTIHEVDKHINDMRIIKLENKDIGVTTFYEKEGTYVVVVYDQKEVAKYSSLQSPYIYQFELHFLFLELK